MRREIGDAGHSNDREGDKERGLPADGVDDVAREESSDGCADDEGTRGEAGGGLTRRELRGGVERHDGHEQVKDHELCEVHEPGEDEGGRDEPWARRARRGGGTSGRGRGKHLKSCGDKRTRVTLLPRRGALHARCMRTARVVRSGIRRAPYERRVRAGRRGLFRGVSWGTIPV